MARTRTLLASPILGVSVSTVTGVAITARSSTAPLAFAADRRQATSPGMNSPIVLNIGRHSRLSPVSTGVVKSSRHTHVGVPALPRARPRNAARGTSTVRLTDIGALPGHYWLHYGKIWPGHPLREKARFADAFAIGVPARVYSASRIREAAIGIAAYLDPHLEMKRKPTGLSLRSAFVSWAPNMFAVCTPVFAAVEPASFSPPRPSAASPAVPRSHY